MLTYVNQLLTNKMIKIYDKKDNSVSYLTIQYLPWLNSDWNDRWLKISPTCYDIPVNIKYTVKPAHAVTSIKQSPVLKGHLFLILSQVNFLWIEPLLRGHLY